MRRMAQIFVAFSEKLNFTGEFHKKYQAQIGILEKIIKQNKRTENLVRDSRVVLHNVVN